MNSKIYKSKVSPTDVKRNIENKENYLLWKFNFLKQILIASSAVLGCMIALPPIQDTLLPSQNTLQYQNRDPTLYSYVLQGVYTVSVVSLVLGILCLAVALYSHVHLKKNQIHNHKIHVYNRAKIDASDDKKPKQLPKVYKYVERIGYVLLSLSIIGFAVYLIFK